MEGRGGGLMEGRWRANGGRWSGANRETVEG